MIMRKYNKSRTKSQKTAIFRTGGQISATSVRHQCDLIPIISQLSQYTPQHHSLQSEEHSTTP